jgi:hypothetical protein
VTSSKQTLSCRDDRIRFELATGNWKLTASPPEAMTFRLFAWQPPQPIEQIGSMEPAITDQVKNRG